MKEKSKRKSVGSAIILNIVIAGLGMAYLKQYTKAVLSFIIVYAAGVISLYLFGAVYYLALLGYALIIAWVYDETKKYNENL